MKLYKFVTFFSFIILSSATYAHENYNSQKEAHAHYQAEKIYINPQNVMFDGSDIYVCLNQNWHQTTGLFSDAQGMFTYNAYIADREKKWQCPYCYHWWPFGQKCQNPQCPTNKW